MAFATCVINVCFGGFSGPVLNNFCKLYLSFDPSTQTCTGVILYCKQYVLYPDNILQSKMFV